MMFVVVLASALAVQIPAPVASDEVRVATSALHTIVIAPDGRVLCQGRNQYGVCGADQATAFVETLSPVPGIPRGRAVAVADSWTSMVLGEDGTRYLWGPAGTADDRVLRVPTVMTTFALSTPRKP
jgi:alpha-tubulin suppressor-like RCC1 family protein